MLHEQDKLGNVYDHASLEVIIHYLVFLLFCTFNMITDITKYDIIIVAIAPGKREKQNL